MKNKLKKLCKIVLIGSAVICVFAIGFYVFQPLSRSNEGVKRYFLRRVPLGTTWDETVDIVEEHGKWEIDVLYPKSCLVINTLHDTGHPSEEPPEPKENLETVGVKTMLIELGTFMEPFSTTVYVYAAYDENDKLIRVVVRRDVDSF